MELERMMEAAGIMPLASVVGSGIDLLPRGIPPITRASISECAVLEVDGSKVLVVRLKGSPRAATASRVLESVSRAAGCPAMAYFDMLSRHMRAALLRERVPFATEDGQFFVPGAISLLPMAADGAAPAPRKLSPAAMRAFIWWLSKEGGAGTQDVANALGVSRATAARACESLVAAGALAKRMVGIRKHTALYEMRNGVEGARAGSLAFGDPVRAEYFVEASKAAGLPLCGESALAERSLLAMPRIPMLAASQEEGKALAAYADELEAFPDPVKVKVLAYDPRPQSSNGLVDEFTMMKTLDDPDDERVVLSLEEALGGCPWYESRE